MVKWTYIKESDLNKDKPVTSTETIISSNFNVVGIGLSTEDARLRPKDKLSTTTIQLSTQTTGKLFVAIKDDNPDVPNAFGLMFNDKQVPIRKNEMAMQTNSVNPPESGYKAYAFDVPMGVISPATKPAEFTIQFLMGTIKDREFIQDGRSKKFILEVTSDEVKPSKSD